MSRTDTRTWGRSLALFAAFAVMAFASSTAAAQCAQAYNDQGVLVCKTQLATADSAPAHRFADNSSPASYAASNVPPQLTLRTVDDYGNPNHIDTEKAVAELTARYGGGQGGRERALADARTIALDNQEQCSILRSSDTDQNALDAELKQLALDLAKEPGKRKKWTIGRLLLGAVQVGSAIAMPMERTSKILYALMVAAGQAQTIGDRVEYDRIMGLYQRYMEHYSKQMQLHSDRGKLWDVKMTRWCNAMGMWDSAYQVTVQH